MADNNMNIGTRQPLGNAYRLIGNQQPAGGAVGGPAYATDQLNLNPIGGAGDDPNLLAQTDQMMRSPDLGQRYQAIINMTKMTPQNAIPRLQAVLQTPGQDPNVVNLANRALAVMQQAAQQPAGQPNGQPYGQPNGQPYGQPNGQPYQQQPNGYTPPAYQPPQAYNPGVAGAPMNQEDAAITLQSLQTDLAQGPDRIGAVREMMGMLQANPGLKDTVFNILLNHVYYKRDDSVTEAIKALGSMNDPRVAPYMAAVARDPGYFHTATEAASQVLMQNAQTPPGGPGVASTGGVQDITYIRAMEADLYNGNGLRALGQLRQALGADPRQQTAARQEVLRVLLTYVATKKDPTTLNPCIQMLGEMKAKEATRYLEALSRDPGVLSETQTLARGVMRQIMQP